MSNLSSFSFGNIIEIDKDNPFKNDVLHRKENIMILTDLVENINKEMVLTIDSIWGSGKTTFVRMWEQYLKNQGYTTLYFNAWENDFVEEPFIAFVNEFEDILKEHPKFEKFKEVSKGVIKGIIPGVVKMATAGMLDLDRINLGIENEKTILAYSEKIADEQMKKYKNTKNAMKEFKKVLTEFIEEKLNKDNKPIVFFIDELDRCRPNFSVQLLEKIKHLFNIKGIIFVLAIDKKELGNSIKAIYGQDMDVNGYLARFFDLEYSLPEPPSELYINYMFDKFNIRPMIVNRSVDNDFEFLSKITIGIFKALNLPLRIQEKIIMRLVLILTTMKDNNYLYEPLLVLLICLKTVDKDFYYKICLKNIDYKEFIGYMGEKYMLEEYFENYEDFGGELYASLLWIFNAKGEIEMIKIQLDNEPVDESFSGEYFDKLQSTLEVYERLKRRNGKYKSVLNYLYKKIELCDNFIINNI